MSKLFKILKIRESIQTEEGYFYDKFYRLNPLTLLFFLVILIIAPFVSMFTETTVQESYRDLFTIIRKGKI